MCERKPALFNVGRTVATVGALAAFEQAAESPACYLSRHVRGDWGDVPKKDAKLNDDSIETKDRIISSYTLKNGTRIWIITDCGHETTTLLLPEEY